MLLWTRLPNQLSSQACRSKSRMFLHTPIPHDRVFIPFPHIFLFLLFQDYLREQEDNPVSVNVISELMQFLRAMYHSIDQDTIFLVVQILSTLSAVCLGNKCVKMFA